MIRKLTSPIPGHVRIVFELPASVWADRIYLTGDFNDWRDNDIPLRQARDGVWRVALDLPAGHRFQFRYVVDGQWQTDWCADGAEQSAFGSQNSVVATDRPEAASDIHLSNRVRYPLPRSAPDERVEPAQTRPAA